MILLTVLLIILISKQINDTTDRFVNHSLHDEVIELKKRHLVFRFVELNEGTVFAATVFTPVYGMPINKR